MHLLRKFSRDEHASITVEFVIVLPLLLFWFLGSIVFFEAYRARTEASAATYTIADIISRNDQMNTGYLNLLSLLQSALLPRADSGGLRVSSIQFNLNDPADDADDTYQVIWSKVASFGAPGGYLPLLDIDIPDEVMPLMTDSEIIMLVESFIPYTPLTAWVGIGTQTFRQKVVISPRFESRIIWVN